MAAEPPSQLVISHGSAAGSDPAVAPSDTLTLLPRSKVPRHGERSVSVTPVDRSVEREDAKQMAASILDVALSEDSLGLTPPKAQGRRERAASGPRSRRDLMPQRAVLRSASGARKARAAQRYASPAELKKLRNLQDVAPPVDRSVEARLAALEAGSAAHFGYMQEAGLAIQALQTMVGGHEQRLDEANEATGRQAMEQAELLRATRRELFGATQHAEVSLNAGIAAVVEAKFEQLEGFILQLQTHFVGLSEREAAVEGVVAKDENTVENAFAYVDAKINQVGEIVKRFETGTAAASFGGNLSPFTVKMRESMQQMHSKLESIDAVLLLTVQEHTTPLQVQLTSLQQQAGAQFEQISILTTAMTSPYPTDAETYGAGKPESPWTAAAAAGHQFVAPSGGAGASDHVAAATMARIIGGNGTCHCIHLTELAQEVEKIKAVLNRADPWKGGNDPWSARAPGAPTPGDGGPGGGGSAGGGGAPGGGGGAPGGGGGGPPGRPGHGAHPGSPPGMASAVTTHTRLFEEKTARDSQFAYDGNAKGSTWRSDVFDYFISKCPDAEPWLVWVEQQGAKKIEESSITAKALSGDLMTEISPFVLSHHIWGFMQHCLSGAAKQTFKNTARRDGFNVWRVLVLAINSQTPCRRYNLRDRVQSPAQVSDNKHVAQGLADWETLYGEYKDAGGIEMDFEERRSQLLKILPSLIRKDVFRKMSEFDSIEEIVEYLRVQIELETQWGDDDKDRRGGR